MTLRWVAAGTRQPALSLPAVGLKHLAAGAAKLRPMLLQALLDRVVAVVENLAAQPRRIARASAPLFRRATLRAGIATPENQD